MNPFVVEDVAVNAAVSEFANRTRYYGGVSGLGQCLPVRRRGVGLRGLGAASLQQMRPEWHGKCPSGSSPGPVAASGNQYCIPDASAQTVSTVETSEPKYTASFMSPDGREVKSSFDIWKPGTLVAETEESKASGGGGFFSSLMDAAGKMFTGATSQQSYIQPVKESSPWPWVVGGVAVAGLAVFALTRSKR